MFVKHGRWMTVVFHNSRNAVWNAIQEAMLAAGFSLPMFVLWTSSRVPYRHNYRSSVTLGRESGSRPVGAWQASDLGSDSSVHQTL